MSCCGPDEDDVAAIVAAALLAASSFRVEGSSTDPYVLSDADFPSLADPRPVLLVLTGVETVNIPGTLTQPVGAFLNVIQGDASQFRYSGTSGATLIAANGNTEDKSGGDDTQQVLEQTSAGIWRLAGRTSA